MVLLDLEWIENTNKEKHLTQLSAIRLDDAWNTVNAFRALLNPGAAQLRRIDHMAFGGYPAEQFLRGMTEKTCIRDFEKWLTPDEEIWVWANTNQNYFASLWYHYAQKLQPTIYSTANYVRNDIIRNHSKESPHKLLSALGEEAPLPEHRAENDTEAFRRLIKRLRIKQPPLTGVETTPLPIRPQQKEINRKQIEGSQYNYIYLKGADVFHRRSCPNWLNAENEKDIFGSVYYKTAAAGRQPCRFCKPKPPAESLPAEKNVCPKDHPEADKKEPNPDTLINIRLFSGRFLQMKCGNVVGVCHCKTHPGAIDKQLCKSHDCLGKQCAYFERNPLSFYLASIEAEKREKQKRRDRIRIEKERKKTEEKELQSLQIIWQSYLDEIRSDMEIIRIERSAPNEYRVFYVSDHCFADGNRYPKFLNMLRSMYPHWKIALRHIRDVDGRFVTRDAFFALRPDLDRNRTA